MVIQGHVPHVWSNLGNLIYLEHLFRSAEVTNQIFFLRKTVLLHTCATSSELPSNIRTMTGRVNSSLLTQVIFQYSKVVF